eukprot:11424820-Alexandrium_andersonii.AAC.1
MWVDGERLVFNNGAPPDVGCAGAASGHAPAPMRAGPPPPSAAPAAQPAAQASAPTPPPSDVEPFLGQWADFEAAADARKGPARYDPADPTPPDGRAG